MRGCAASREVTWSKGAYHVHIHLIYDGEFWSQPELSKEWRRVTDGESWVVDIREAREGAEIELVKYAVKTLALPDECLVEFAQTMRHARLIGTGGTWRKVKPPEQPSDVPEEPGWELMTLAGLWRRTQDGESPACEIALALVRWCEQVSGRRLADELRAAFFGPDRTEKQRDGPVAIRTWAH